MGAARHRCEYLARHQAEMFLLAGGDSQWLEDPSSLPPKLAALAEVNAFMAHCPWMLEAKVITLLKT